MPFKELPAETATLLFRLSHVSKLFVFERNFYNHCEMIRIIAEVLRVRSYELLQVSGTQRGAVEYETFFDSSEDCAIVRVNLLDAEHHVAKGGALQKHFLDQLENENNIFAVDSTVVSKQKNTSIVDIVISSNFRRAKSNAA